MPIAFGVAAVILIVAGVRGQTGNLVSLVKADFSGQPNYFEWIIAIVLVGAVGYIDELKTISRMFMGLLVLSLLWSNKNVFAQFTSQETAQPQQGTLTSPYNNPDATNIPNLPALPGVQGLTGVFPAGTPLS